jgi:hypothetical protein
MVHVFKTSVTSESDISELQPALNNLAADIKWNFDLEDCDNILRVISSEMIQSDVINILKNHQHQCEELE